MKKTKLFFIPFLLLLLLISCTNEVKDSDTYVVTFSVDSASPKALEANISAPEGVQYYAVLTQSEGSRFIRYDGETKENGEAFLMTKATKALELSKGEWSLHVEGRVGDSVVYTSLPEGTGATDIRLKVTSAGMTILQCGVGAQLSSSTLTVSVRNLKDGKATFKKGTIGSLTTPSDWAGNGYGYTLNWYWSDDYETFTLWNGTTMEADAGRPYWVRINAETPDHTILASGITEVFCPYKGETVIVDGTLTPSTFRISYTNLYDSSTNPICQEVYTYGSAFSLKVLQNPIPGLYPDFEGWYQDENMPEGTNRLTLPAGIYGDLSLYADYANSCFVEGTLVTLADGTKRAIEDIALGDEILTWNFYNGSLEQKTVCVLEHIAIPQTKHVVTLTTSSGQTVAFADAQAFFDTDARDYFEINYVNYSEMVGRPIAMMVGEQLVPTTIVAISMEEKDVQCYDIVTTENFNFFAEDLLTIYPGTFMLLPYELDEEFKVKEDLMLGDIATYGLYTRDTFPVEMTEEEFEAYGLAHYKVLEGKGLVNAAYYPFAFDYLDRYLDCLY